MNILPSDCSARFQIAAFGPGPTPEPGLKVGTVTPVRHYFEALNLVDGSSTEPERGVGVWRAVSAAFCGKKTHLEERFAIRITDDDLRHAIRLMNRERALRRQLAELMAHDPPPLTGRQLLELKSIISGLQPDLDQYELALHSLSTRIAPTPTTRDRRVRVLLTGVPLVHGAERVLELIEDAGAVVVAMENCTGLKPILDDVDEHDPDPLAAIARK